MKTQLLIEAETDGDKCGGGCPLIVRNHLYYSYYLKCPFRESVKIGETKRGDACLAAEAAAKKLHFENYLKRSSEIVSKFPPWKKDIYGIDVKRKFDDPVVKEGIGLAKIIVAKKTLSKFSTVRPTEEALLIIIKALLKLAGEEE